VRGRPGGEGNNGTDGVHGQMTMSSRLVSSCLVRFIAWGVDGCGRVGDAITAWPPLRPEGHEPVASEMLPLPGPSGDGLARGGVPVAGCPWRLTG